MHDQGHQLNLLQSPDWFMDSGCGQIIAQSRVHDGTENKLFCLKLGYTLL